MSLTPASLGRQKQESVTVPAVNLQRWRLIYIKTRAIRTSYCIKQFREKKKNLKTSFEFLLKRYIFLSLLLFILFCL